MCVCVMVFRFGAIQWPSVASQDISINLASRQELAAARIIDLTKKHHVASNLTLGCSMDPT